MEPPLYTCFLGPSRVQIQNGISIGSAVFAQLTTYLPHTLQWTALQSSLLWQTDRQTDRPTGIYTDHATWSV